MKKLPLLDENKPWYHKGLKFKCTGCGKCCSGAPGFVFLTEEDIESIIKVLSITREEFVKKYTKSFGKRLSLRDDTPNYGCIFLKDGKYCKIYQARPLQCRTYPFWLMNIHTERQWMEESERCEGINHPEGEVFTKEAIEKIAATHAGLLSESDS